MRTLLRNGDEATIIEQKRDRFERLESESNTRRRGDATELYTPEGRDPAVPALLVLCPHRRRRGEPPSPAARQGEVRRPEDHRASQRPRNQSHSPPARHLADGVRDLQAFSGSSSRCPGARSACIWLELRKENLEIVEVQIDKAVADRGKTVEKLRLPQGSRLISVTARRATRRSWSGRPSRSLATRYWRSCSRARKTSSAGILRRSRQRLEPPGGGVTTFGECLAHFLAAAAPRLPASQAQQNFHSDRSHRGFGAHRHRLEPGGASAPLRGRAGRANSLLRERQASRHVSGHQEPGLERRRARAALRCVPSQLREEPSLLRELHGSQRKHSRRRVPVPRNGRAIKSSGRQLLFVRQPYANHNGGELQFDSKGLLYVGMGDGGSGGDPATARSARARSSASCCGSIRFVAARAGRSSGSVSVTPGASRSTAQTATSTSVTWGRTPGKRSTSGRRLRSPRSRTTAGMSTKDERATRTLRSGRDSS